VTLCKRFLASEDKLFFSDSFNDVVGTFRRQTLSRLATTVNYYAAATPPMYLVYRVSNITGWM